MNIRMKEEKEENKEDKDVNKTYSDENKGRKMNKEHPKKTEKTSLKRKAETMEQCENKAKTQRKGRKIENGEDIRRFFRRKEGRLMKKKFV